MQQPTHESTVQIDSAIEHRISTVPEHAKPAMHSLSVHEAVAVGNSSTAHARTVARSECGAVDWIIGKYVLLAAVEEPAAAEDEAGLELASKAAVL